MVAGDGAPVIMVGKRRITRGTNRIGVRDGSKHALVTLEAGNQIPLFEN